MDLDIALGVNNLDLKQKLITNYLILTYVTIFLVGFAVMYGIQRLSINTIEKQLVDQSSLAEIYISQIHILEDGSDKINPDTANKIIGKLSLILGNVRIYDTDLNLLAFTKGQVESSINDIENNKILEAALQGNYAYKLKDSIIHFASPIEIGSDTIGLLEIIYRLNFLESLISGVTNILLVGAVLFTIIIALLGSFIADRLTRPINKLAKAAKSFAGRDFTPVEIKGSDEISQLSKSFNDMGTQLQDYIKRQKSFISNVSHELNTPLTAIKGYSELLKEEVTDRPDLQKAVYHLNNESVRLAKLVNEILTLSKIDTEKYSFNIELINFSDLIKDTIERMLLRSEKYGIKILSKIESDVLIKGDREKLMQVIVNLLDNAFKYSSPQSSIGVTSGKEDHMAFLIISDQGIGIPKEDTKKVFDRFYRAENAKGISGTGLGLSLVKHIIESHEGNVVIKGNQGKGTTVIVKLPLHE